MVVRAAADLNVRSASRAGVTQRTHESRSYSVLILSLHLLWLHINHPKTVIVWHEGLRPRIPDIIPQMVQAEDLTTDLEISYPRGSKKPSPETQVAVSWGIIKLYRARLSSRQCPWDDVSTDEAMPETVTLQRQRRL
jgi:hypothetical protein